METRMHASPARDRSVAQRSPQEGTFRPAAAGRTARPTACSSVLVLVLSLSLSLLLLAACRSPFAAPTPLPQRTLQVSVLTSDGTAPTSIAAGQAVVDVLFDSDPGSDERVSCGGTALAQVTTNTGRIYFQGTLPAPAGRPFACTYTGQSQVVELAFAAAQPLQLSAPTSGSVIARQEPLTLTCSGGQPGSSLWVMGGAQKDADAVVPPAHAVVALAHGPNTGSLLLAPSLLANLRPGAGVLLVTQTYTTSLAGTPFKSAQVDYETRTSVALIWA
jgi:hypothetical protein